MAEKTILALILMFKRVLGMIYHNGLLIAVGVRLRAL